MSEGVGQVLRTGSTSRSDVPPEDQATVARMRSTFASLWEFVVPACPHSRKRTKKHTLFHCFV